MGKNRIAKLVSQMFAGLFCAALAITLFPQFELGRADETSGITLSMTGGSYSDSERSYTWNVTVNPGGSELSKIVLVSNPTPQNVNGKSYAAHRFLDPIGLSESTRETTQNNIASSIKNSNPSLASANVEVTITDNHSDKNLQDDMTIVIEAPEDSTINDNINFSFKTYSSLAMNYGSNRNERVSNQITLTNETKVSSGEDEETDLTNPLTKSASITPKSASFISQRAVGYNAETNSITYEINVNSRKTFLDKVKIDCLIYLYPNITRREFFKYKIDSAKIKWDGETEFSPLKNELKEGIFGQINSPGANNQYGITENTFFYPSALDCFTITLTGKPGSERGVDTSCVIRYDVCLDPKGYVNGNSGNLFDVTTEIFTYVKKVYEDRWELFDECDRRNDGNAMQKIWNKVPNEIARETGSFISEDSLKYEINVNPYGGSISNRDDGKYTITEVFDPRIKDVYDVKVYRAKSKSFTKEESGGKANEFFITPLNKNFLIIDEEVSNPKYSIERENGKIKLNVTVDDSTPYIITYSVTTDGSTGPFNNGLNMGGTRFEGSKDVSGNYTSSFSSNTLSLGGIKITATDKDDSSTISGIEYGVYTDSSATTLKKSGTTDESGMVTIEPLMAGKYYVKEISPNALYEPNGEIKTIDINAAQVTASFSNTKKTQSEEPETTPENTGEKDPENTGDKDSENTDGTEPGDTGESTPEKPTGETTPKPPVTNIPVWTAPVQPATPNTIDKNTDSTTEDKQEKPVTPPAKEDSKTETAKPVEPQVESLEASNLVQSDTTNSDIIIETSKFAKPTTPKAPEKTETTEATEADKTLTNQDTNQSGTSGEIAINIPTATETQAEVTVDNAVAFHSDIDFSHDPNKLTKGTVVDGHRFDGWFLEPEYINEHDISVPLADGGKLYAKWTKLEDEGKNIWIPLAVCLGFAVTFAGGATSALYIAARKRKKGH